MIREIPSDRGQGAALLPAMMLSPVVPETSLRQPEISETSRVVSGCAVQPEDLPMMTDAEIEAIVGELAMRGLAAGRLVSARRTLVEWQMMGVGAKTARELILSTPVQGVVLGGGV